MFFSVGKWERWLSHWSKAAKGRLLPGFAVWIISWLFFIQPLAAQVVNDDCFTALRLNDVSNWCSPVAGYSTIGATVSGDVRACFPLSGNGPDIWFSFVATGTSMHLSVKGATSNSPGGTLTFPQLILYSGSCGNLAPIQCSSDALGSNYVETVAEKLQIGQIYLIRVSARNNKSGSFQLCLNNYSPTPNPLADCITGRILCSKDPLTIPFVEGEGVNPFEIGDGACAKNGCKPLERQTTWLKWTCGVQGSLTFTITPLHASDDIDFIVFELGGGLQTCGSLTPVKCMSAGENTGQPVSNWISCSGSTGLKEDDTDEAEFCGCSATSNNFLSPLQMTVGKSYALAVINYSSSGHGFQISFGGDGVFSGSTGGMNPNGLLDIHKSVSPSWLPISPNQETSLQYQLTFVNHSNIPVTIDSVLDRVLSPLSYAGTIDTLSAIKNSNSIQYPSVPASGNIQWKGALPNRYLVPGMDSLKLVYKATLPANAPVGTYLGRGKGYVGACPTDSVAAPFSIGVNCPTISGDIIGPEGACAGGSQVAWKVNGLGNMVNPSVSGWNYGIRFVYFSTSSPLDVYSPEGILGDAVLSDDKSDAVLKMGNLPATPGVYYVFAILQPAPVAGGCRPYAGPFVLRVINEPVVGLYGGGAVCPGNSLILSATVSGGAGTCQLQWQALNANTNTWEPVSASIQPNLVVAPTQTTTYRVALLCSGTGCSEAFSNTQTVTVTNEVKLTLQATPTVCPGGTVTLQAQVAGATGACTFTWQRSLDSLVWETMSTSTTNGYNVQPTQSAFYRVLATCPGTSCIWSSNVQRSELSVAPQVTMSGSASVCAGTPVVLRATQTGGIPSCQVIWQSSIDGVNWTSFSSQVKDTMVVSPAVSTLYRVVYYCAAGNCGSDTSGIYAVTVFPRPSVQAAGAVAICSGGTAVLSAQVISGAGSCTLQWQYYHAASAVWSDLPSATGTRLTVIPSETTQYRVRYSCTGNGCGTVYSNIVEISVSPDPGISVTGSTDLCPGGSGSLQAVVQGGTGTCSLGWEKWENNAWVKIPGATSAVLPIQDLASSTKFRATYTCTGAFCDSIVSNEWLVTVQPKAPVAITGAAKVCVGEQTALRVIDSTGSCAIQWVKWDSLAQHWAVIPGADASVFTFTALQSETYAIQYACPGQACENGISSSFFVDVLQKPVVRIEGPSLVCAGDSLTLQLQLMNGRESCFPVWQQSTDKLNWSTVSGSGLSVQPRLTESAWFRVIYFCLSNCTDTSDLFFVDVRLQNQLQLTGAADICQGGQVELQVNTVDNLANCTIQWYASTDGGSWIPVSEYHSSKLLVQPTESTAYRATYSCLPAVCPEVSSNTIWVNVAEPPSVSLTGPASVCAGGSVRIQSQLGGGLGECGLTWQISTDSVNWKAVSSTSRFSYEFSPISTTFVRAGYSCSGTGCGTVYSLPHKVTVFPDPKVTLDGPNVVCAGNTILLTASVSGGYGKCTLRWHQSSDGVNWTVISGWSAAIISLEPLNTTYYRAEYTCDGTHCGGSFSPMLKVTVESGAEGKNDTKQLASCTAVGYDLQRNVNLLGNGKASTYWWVATADNPLVLGETLTPVQGAVITDILSNISTEPQVLTYRVTAGEGKCPNSVFFIQVTIAPRVPISCSGCVSNPVLFLNPSCELEITPGQLLSSLKPDCADSAKIAGLLEVLVEDGTPDAFVASCGKFPYTLQLKSGLENCYVFSPCKGVVEVVDTTGPELISLVKRCGGNPLAGASWSDTLWCSDIAHIYEKPESWQDSTYSFFTGTVVFEDACASSCQCSTTLEVRDELQYLDCSSVLQHRIWAVLKRTFIGKDCHGNESKVVQMLYFERPALDPDFYSRAGIRELNVEQSSCESPPVADLIRWFKERYYLFEEPGFCQGKPRKAAFFQEALAAGNASSLLDCGYQYEVLVLDEQRICSNGVKVEITVQAKDICTGRTMSLDTFDLISSDKVPPVIAHSFKTVNLSTRPDACETSFGIDQVGLERYFGIKVSDNCDNNPKVSVVIYYYGPMYVNGVPSGADEWRIADYPRILVKGLDGKDYLTATKVRTGKHRLVIEARDDCMNLSTSEFEFTVLDQIAPTMKCADRFTALLRVVDGKSTVKVTKAELDKGTTDNCGLAWVRVRRPYNPAALSDFIEKGYDSNNDHLINQLDGKDWNGDGDLDDYGERFVFDLKTGKYLTPLLDYVEFFCADAGNSYQIEVWAQDFSGNLASCTTTLQIEDVLDPTWTLPSPKGLSCTDESLMAVLGQSLTFVDSSWQYKRIVAFLGRDIEIKSGLECGTHSTRIEVRQELDCGAGRVGLTWIIVKVSGGRMLLRRTETIYLPVDKVVGYELVFPADTLVYSCAESALPPAVVLSKISGCANLGTYEHRRLVPPSDAGSSCYTIERKITVINWCAYAESCGDPLFWAVEVPRQNGKEVRLIVTDTAPKDGVEELFYDTNGNGWAEPSERISNPSYISGSGPCTSSKGGQVSWTYTQLVQVLDTVPPIIQVVQELPDRPIKGGCKGAVQLRVSLVDDCLLLADTMDARWMFAQLQLDSIWITPDPAAYPGGKRLLTQFLPSIEIAQVGVQSWVIRGDFPEGVHVVELNVKDPCGNRSDTYTHTVRIIDNSIPSPVCNGLLSIEIQPFDSNGDGIADIGKSFMVARDFVAQPIFDCNGQGQADSVGLREILTYSIQRNGEVPSAKKDSIWFTCSEAWNYVPVTLYAWDERGNYSSCPSYVLVSDESGGCASFTAQIGGTIRTEKGVSVEAAEVRLKGGAEALQLSDQKGTYLFSGLGKPYGYSISSYKNNDYLNGVSTLDLILIQQHILGERYFQTPYQYIAADINNSGSVTILDMIWLRRAILDQVTGFPSNLSWRFVPASYTFPNPGNPWVPVFPESVSYGSLPADIQNANFIGVKIGDVNGDVVANSSVRGNPEAGKKKVQLVLFPEESSGLQRLEMRLDQVEEAAGAQFSLFVDTTQLEVVGWMDGLATQEEWVYREGILRCSWVRPTGALRSGALLTCMVRPKSKLSLDHSIALLSRALSPESYGFHGELYPLTLDFHASTTAEGAPVLFQNIPNPFSSTTTIAFWLPKAQYAQLDVFSLDGRLVYSRSGQFSAGTSEITIDKSELEARGVLFYTLKTQSALASKKMLLIE